jgi:NADPH:quinone reductase-like Zn-dependent oxidoreductase
MRAVQILDDWGLDALKVVDIEEAKLGHGQVRIAVRAVSLNFRDLRVAQGLYNPKLRRPLTICSDCAGEVVEIGPGVTRAKVGDRVALAFMPGWVAGEPTDAGAKSALGAFAHGVLAERVVEHENGLVHLPEHLSFQEAATLPCAAVTAWHGLVVRSKIKAGDTVVTQGSGGVSVFALQFAKMHGARVIATSSSNEKLARLRALGADETINYKTTPDWDDAVRAMTGGVGAHHIVDVVGSAALNRSMKAARMGGNIISIGVVSGGAEAEMRLAFMKNATVHGIFVGSREMFEAMNRAITQAKLRPVIDRTFKMDQIQEALRHMEAGAHFGKIVVEVNQG